MAEPILPMPAMPIFMRCSLLLALFLAACQSEMTPLHIAAQSGDTAVVKQWIADRKNLDPRWDEASRGLEGNYARRVDITPLMLAAGNGQLETAKLLVEGGADLYAQANTQLKGEPITAFDFAVNGGSVPVADYLWNKAADKTRLTTRLMNHVASACIAHCKPGAATDAKTNPALYLISIAPPEIAGGGVGSAVCSSIKPLETLEFIEKHAERAPRNTLHCMAYQVYSRHRPVEERKAVLTWMLDHGAEVNGRLFGHTPLRGAAAAHDLDTAKLLVERGADPKALDAEGLPPISGAANTCIHPAPGGGPIPQLDAELAMVEYLRPMSDPSVYASPETLKKAYLIGRCCSEKQQAPAQRRICEVFGL
jgi:ankyrin repeat protein